MSKLSEILSDLENGKINAKYAEFKIINAYKERYVSQPEYGYWGGELYNFSNPFDDNKGN